MDMNRMFLLRVEDRQPKWQIIDAKGKILGRLATEIADILRGKNKAIYTPHTMSGDYVVVINARHVVFTGDKMEQKIYERVSGWMSGKRETSARDMLLKHPTFLVEHAVKGMLPKNKLSAKIMKTLKIYPDAEHPHAAQFGL